MIKPSINTFAPAENINGPRFELPLLNKGSSIVVVGAGVFGGWSSLYLQRAGFKVILIDAFGAGNSRSSSGDETRVCPYENSPDGNFIFDIHPEAENLFFLGGGSGHGFKHGPALGELVAKVLNGEQKVPRIFALGKPDQRFFLLVILLVLFPFLR